MVSCGETERQTGRALRDRMKVAVTILSYHHFTAVLVAPFAISAISMCLSRRVVCNVHETPLFATTSVLKEHEIVTLDSQGIYDSRSSEVVAKLSTEMTSTYVNHYALYNSLMCEKGEVVANAPLSPTPASTYDGAG